MVAVWRPHCIPGSQGCGYQIQLRVENGSLQPLSHLESFVRSAEARSFSAAARQLGLTPAAVSKNVARLEAGLGMRLLPGWYAEGGPVSLYYPSMKLLPAKTRGFVDFRVERFRSRDFSMQVRGA